MNPKPPRSVQKHLAHIKRTQRDHLFYAFVAPYLNRLPTTRTQELKLQYPPEFTINQIRHQWRKHFEGDFSTAGRFKLSFTPHPNGWILTITRKDFPQPACASVLFSDETEVPSPTAIPTEPYVAPWIKEAEQQIAAQNYKPKAFEILNKRGYGTKAEPSASAPLCPNSDNPQGREASAPLAPNDYSRIGESEPDPDCELNDDEQELLSAFDEEGDEAASNESNESEEPSDD